MSLYPSEIYSTLETNYLKSDIYFTSLDTIGLKANLINVSTNMIISQGYISGLTNVVDSSSAVNKYYVDTSVQFIPFGTIGAIQFKNQDQLFSSNDLIFTSTNKILRTPLVETDEVKVLELEIGNNILTANQFSDNYNLILPVTTGISGQILGLNNNISKVSDELFSFLNGGTVWNSSRFLTALNLPVFGTGPPPTPDFTITFGLSDNGLQWTTYVFPEKGFALFPKWLNNSYFVSFGNELGTAFYLLKSNDGLSWTTVFETDRGIPNIAFSDYLDTYVGITGNSSGNCISLLSVDLINWTTYNQNFGIDSGLISTFLWIEELKLFITYDNSTFSYFLSENGIDWNIYNNVLDFRPTSCTWAPELGIISLTGRGGCAVSVDGINWTTSGYLFGLNDSDDIQLTRTVWCPPIEGIRPGYFLSSVSGEVSLNLLKPVISTNGLNWAIYSNDYGGNFAGIAYQSENDIVSFIPSYLSNAYIIDFGNYLTFFDNGFIPAGSNQSVQIGQSGIFTYNSDLNFDKSINTLSVTSSNTISVQTSFFTNINTNSLTIGNTILKTQTSFTDFTINLPNDAPGNNEVIFTNGINSFNFSNSGNSIPKGPSNSIQINELGDLSSSEMTFNPDTELYIPGPINQLNQISFALEDSISSVIESFYLSGNVLYSVGGDILNFIPTDDFQIINQLNFTSCSKIFINNYYSFLTNTESLIISNISGNGLYFNTQVSSILVSTSGTSIPLCVYNNYCYLGLDNELMKVDISSLHSPTTISKLNITGINNLITHDDYLYLSNSSNFMKVDLNTFTTESSLSISGITSFSINGGFAYVGNSTDLIVVEIFNFEVTTSISVSNINCVYSTNSLLYLGTNSEIKVFNITSIVPSFIQDYTDSNINGIVILGTKLYYFTNTDLKVLDIKGSNLTSMTCGDIITNQITVLNNVFNEGNLNCNSINVSNTLFVENIKLYKEIIDLIDYSNITCDCYNAIVNISDSSSISSGSYVDIVIFNNNVTLNSQINVGILTYNYGLPYINVIEKLNGEFTIRIYNFEETLFGVVRFYFIIY